MRKKINEIKNMTAKMPKTIMEAVDFSDNELTDNDFGFEEEMPEQDTMVSEPMPMDKPETHEQNPIAQDKPNDGMVVVDTIRKMALKTMAELADNPDDPAYVVLKKVWQMCDKKPEDQNKNSME